VLVPDVAEVKHRGVAEVSYTLPVSDSTYMQESKMIDVAAA